MKLLECPLNGMRNLQEFVYGGDVAQEPKAEASTEEWSHHVFLEVNSAGVVDEWWYHVPSGYWFIVRRDRSRDVILETFTPDDYFDGTAKLS